MTGMTTMKIIQVLNMTRYFNQSMNDYIYLYVYRGMQCIIYQYNLLCRFDTITLEEHEFG